MSSVTLRRQRERHARSRDVTSGPRVIAFADVNCHSSAVPRSAKATLMVACVVSLIDPLIVNAPSPDRSAANAAAHWDREPLQ
jgi:hypothetical protein